MTAPPSSTGSPETPPAVARLVARERVRAMESLAGAIAHEIRAAVLGVTSAAQLLRYSIAPDPVAEKSLGRILQEAERLGALHEALSEYATEVPPRLAADDPDGVWITVIRGLRGALEAKSVSITHSAAAPRATSLVDADQMARAYERVVHYALGRIRAGDELAVVSTVDDTSWQSTISIGPESGPPVKTGEFERPAFLLALAHRTLVAHGGEVTEHHADDASLLVTIRLPLSSPPE